MYQSIRLFQEKTVGNKFRTRKVFYQKILRKLSLQSQRRGFYQGFFIKYIKATE